MDDKHLQLLKRWLDAYINGAPTEDMELLSEETAVCLELHNFLTNRDLGDEDGYGAGV